jgi:hypothetical protein
MKCKYCESPADYDGACDECNQEKYSSDLDQHEFRANQDIPENQHQAEIFQDKLDTFRNEY